MNTSVNRTQTNETGERGGVSPPVLQQYTGELTPARSPECLSNEETQRWELRLYIAGQTPKSVTAFANLKKLCEEHLAGRYSIEVIDLMQQPQLAAGDQIVAIPTLIRKLPEPLRRIVGDLSNTERTLVGLQLRPARS